MAKRFYLDTSIWWDYLGDRRDNIRPLGELAFSFIQACLARGHKILYSDLTVDELRQGYSMERIQQAFSAFEEALIRVEISDEQRAEARELAQTRTESHESDLTHAIVARDNGAVLVARDHGFECLRDVVEVRKPEEIIFD
ncbi:MAG TPA: PIN domain-containing protein [Candidatus Diapherotrites archaeon]|uniref:PIN domain-containing protein n=1 Tax=Candidatus Iainarchaeum sp. TaxID=3101447 RepID=A0A7J4JGD6_9ARCH|nr:PIN domain-containing protein [Candidatus Diapherotrites archaeon]HIH16374.1 PIN domain-containing protein [Candidatus Diapherotrites archaeon]